jgi:uncharacterized membrane protein YcaP (DUF421 family)
MWNLALPWWEFVLRGVMVYVFLLVILRITGKRQTGQLAPFDLVLLLVLSNAVQNSMNGGDNTITGGLILATTLVCLNWIVGWLTYHSKHIETFVEGKPIILIHDGKIYHESMRRVQMTQHELEASLRANGCAGPEEVRFAVLENNGLFTVIPKTKKAE